MATITLNYNIRNSKAKNLLNYVISTGLMMLQVESKSGLARAFEDLEKGRVYYSVRRAQDEKRQKQQ
ncbi:MAG: hypothetical protein LBS52_04340 [Dysgonamonadaceae bacterium]|nr:hypothetical protein [Dysgonamonadaceae bacterium]